ncbi:tektin-4 [Eurytemora carolleeae]|uniref:tektin-4 n=1 Tax=Eurytemora carolleeae TaxID=1294199 RepID=UPI000C78DC8B|nr:tektin-4 [Eurytemora carolleeae]|eukprot:XP_023335348.1 tektin-4-like [Eurytemora affinis]
MMGEHNAFTLIKENIEDDRALLQTGIVGTGTEVEKQPILDRYIPAHPVDRYTFKKWDTNDWSRHNENKYFQSERDRDAASNTREEAKQLIHATTSRTNQTQNDVTERLGERLQNINLWKFELEKSIRDITSEIELLVTERRRLEYGIQATEGPLHIARDCLANRQRRIDYDLVQDIAEKELLKEIELIAQVQEILVKTLQQTKDQLDSCREAKHRLEMDWSDKYSAQNLDSKSVQLKNTRGNTQRRAGKALYNLHESLPGDWQTFTDNNIRLAEQEREASIRLRGMIGSTLSNTSQDMREQADRVAQALSDRLSETEEATRNLESNLKKTVDEIAAVESIIRTLKNSIWEKDAPNKVAMTRLTNRHLRPNVELCRDEPAHRLIEEVEEIEDSVRKLEDKLVNSEKNHCELKTTRLSLEKEISVKKNSILIDRDRCLRIRTCFPSGNHLCGYRSNTFGIDQ